jgi:hypothetical protein
MAVGVEGCETSNPIALVGHSERSPARVDQTFE